MLNVNLLSFLGNTDESTLDLLKPLLEAFAEDVKNGGRISSEFIELVKKFTNPMSKAWPSNIGMTERVAYAIPVKAFVKLMESGKSTENG